MNPASEDNFNVVKCWKIKTENSGCARYHVSQNMHPDIFLAKLISSAGFEKIRL